MPNEKSDRENRERRSGKFRTRSFHSGGRANRPGSPGRLISPLRRLISGRRSFERKPRLLNYNPAKHQAPTVSDGATLNIPPVGDNIRIIPLGGVEEIGRNMTAIEIGDDIIVIDAGFQFKDEDTPGIDYILPNTKYLEDRKEKIRGLFITHGHLDHIGGIPYLIEKMGYPTIYSKQFGAIMIQKRQDEFPHLPPLDIKVLDGDETILCGKLKVKTFSISHTIPDSMGLIIETPYGNIVFIEDVRVDNVGGVPTEKEVEQYKRFKDINVLLLTMDSTSIEKHGFSLSESVVIENIERFVKGSPGRLIIGTFASQVERIIAIIKLAEKYNKKMVIEGRSMKTNLEIMKQLKLAEIKNIIPVEEIESYPPDRIIMLVTGAQGEEFSALMRIANKSHKYLRLRKTDTILLSSSIIPTNYMSIVKLKDNLYRSEAKVVTYLDSDIHASGHGNRDELGWIHSQIKYKFFIPLHGHHYMLRQHSELAQSMGIKKENIAVPDNGSIIEIQNQGKSIVILKEKAPSDPVMVDGFSVSDTQEVVLRDRKMLAEDGFVVIVATINLKVGRLRKSPDIISRGFVYLRESQEILSHTRLLVKKIIEESAMHTNPVNFDFIKGNVTNAVSRFLFQKTAKRPIVIPVILGV